ncbi:MAG: hypothetical protein KW804_01315 [Candidatus Doudnabacteria bacterium]|nr:hypothetical protein [Candidatus Doudnabacteria bacterium]
MQKFLDMTGRILGSLAVGFVSAGLIVSLIMPKDAGLAGLGYMFTMIALGFGISVGMFLLLNKSHNKEGYKNSLPRTDKIVYIIMGLMLAVVMPFVASWFVSKYFSVDFSMLFDWINYGSALMGLFFYPYILTRSMEYYYKYLIVIGFFLSPIALAFLISL